MDRGNFKQLELPIQHNREEKPENRDGNTDVDVNIIFYSSRHLLRFLLQSPNGYHVGLCSQTPFTFGDEDQVMICLAKVRLVQHTDYPVC